MGWLILRGVGWRGVFFAAGPGIDAGELVAQAEVLRIGGDPRLQFLALPGGLLADLRQFQRRHLARQVGLAEAGGTGSGREGAGFSHQVESAELGWCHISKTNSKHIEYILDA